MPKCTIRQIILTHSHGGDMLCYHCRTWWTPEHVLDMLEQAGHNTTTR